MLTRALSQETELSTRFTAAAANLELGRTAAAREQMIRCIELARRLRYTGSDVPIAWWRFYRALDAGDIVLAGELATRPRICTAAARRFICRKPRRWSRFASAALGRR